MDLRDLLDLLRGRRLFVLVLAVLAALAAVAFSFLRPATYTSSADLLVQPASATTSSDGPTLSADQQDRYISTQLLIANGEPVQTAAAGLLKADAGSVKDGVVIAQQPNTNIIQITATRSSPSLASRTANAFATAFQRVRHDDAVNRLQSAADALNPQLLGLQQSIDTLTAKLASAATAAERAAIQQNLTATSDQYTALYTEQQQLRAQVALDQGGVSVISSAQPPTHRDGSPARNAILGLLAGLVIALAFVVLRTLLDGRVHSIRDLEAVLPTPIVVQSPRARHRDGSPPPSSMQAIAMDPPIRRLQVGLDVLTWQRAPRAIAVTSAQLEAGSDRVALGLAAAVALTGRSVALITVRPGGDGQSASSSRERQSTATQTGLPGFTQIVCVPSVEFGPAAAGKLLDEARSKSAVVIIDAPGLLNSPQSELLTALSDGLVVVARCDRTRKDDLTRVASVARAMTVFVAGSVLLDAPLGSGHGQTGLRDDELPGGRSDGRVGVPLPPAVALPSFSDEEPDEAALGGKVSVTKPHSHRQPRSPLTRENASVNRMRLQLRDPRRDSSQVEPPARHE